MRDLASRPHPHPDGGVRAYSRNTIDRWIRAYRERGVKTKYVVYAISLLGYISPVRRVEYPKFADWLQALPREAFVAVEADIRYLLEFGRSAVLPYVRLRIQQSAHYPDMAETRTEVADQDGRLWVVRTLAVFADDDSVLAWCVGGDKRSWSDANPGWTGMTRGSRSPMPCSQP